MIKNLNLENIPDVLILDRYANTIGRGIVTIRSLRYFASKMVAEGSMLKLKSNVYAKRVADPFKVAAAVYQGYIGLSSALYLLNLKEEVDDMVLVCVGGNKNRLKFLNKSIVPVNVSRMLYGTIAINGVLCSSFPKTIFDMFYRPKYANFFDTYRAINRRSLLEEEWRILLGYSKSSNIATVRRIGYALESFAPKWFIKSLKALSDAKGKTSSFARPVGGHFINRWKLYDDINIKRWEHAG